MFISVLCENKIETNEIKGYKWNMTMKWLLFLFHIWRVSAAKQLRGWYTDSTKKRAITTSLHMLSSISFTVS